jgi:hypothetical protein
LYKYYIYIKKGAKKLYRNISCNRERREREREKTR